MTVLEDIERREAAQLILDWARPPVITVREVSDEPLKESWNRPMVSGFEARSIGPPEGWQPITEVLPFMAERQITLEDVRVFGLGWCGSGRYAGRMIFPVVESGKLVYFQGRAMWPEASTPGRYIKSLNPARTEGSAVSSEVLMNLDFACRYPRVAIVEGPTDLVRSGPDTVCTFGKAISFVQIRKLLVAGVRAVDLMWDSDAWEPAIGASRVLASYFDTRIVFLPHGDPGDYSRGDLQQYRERSVPADEARMIARL